MSKKLILVFVGVIFFFSSRLVFASLSINEIMYDLSGSDSTSGKSREWIEVYNSGGDISVDASKWRIFDGGANRTINDQVDFSIPANSYVIFAGNKDTFLADNPNFSGTVYDTGISSLNNTGATLKILDQDGNALDSVTYDSTQGGAGDGNSLQLVNGSWVGAMPTPGLANQASVPPPTESSSTPVSSDNSSISTGISSGGSSYSSSSSTTTSSVKNKTTIVSKIKTEITTKTIGFVGVPLSLQAKTFGTNGEQSYNGKYFWNFGDGDSKEESLVGSQSFTHTYFYPGDYVVSLDYSQNYSSTISTPDASGQATVKIIPTDIVISKVGDEKDFFIELTNNTNYGADLSDWIIAGDQKIFKIPRNTTIPTKQKIIISPKITNFSIVDKNFLKLLNPQGYTVFDYSLPASVDKSTDVGRLDASRRPTSVTASAIASNIMDNKLTNEPDSSNESNNSSKIIFFIISFVFIGLAAGSVYFIRRKRIIPQVGSDFEILDE